MRGVKVKQIKKMALEVVQRLRQSGKIKSEGLHRKERSHTLFHLGYRAVYQALKRDYKAGLLPGKLPKLHAKSSACISVQGG